MKFHCPTHFSGGYTSQLTVDYTPEAPSCLLSTHRVWSLSSLAAPVHTCDKKKKNGILKEKKPFHIRRNELRYSV